jgi:hypothetical protein
MVMKVDSQRYKWYSILIYEANTLGLQEELPHFNYQTRTIDFT